MGYDVLYYNRSKGERKQRKEGKKMKINSIMTCENRNNANGARAKKLREYLNAERHMTHRIKRNKNQKG